MRPRQLALPLGFGVLGTGYALLLVPMHGRAVGPVAAVSALLAALLGSIVWATTIGDEPSTRRGAGVAVLAMLTGAVCVTPILSVLFLSWNGTLSLTDLVLLSMLVVLSGLLVSPLAALLGAAVANWFGSLRPVNRLPPAVTDHSDRIYRRFGILIVLFTLAFVGCAAVQYTDPGSPSVGAGPPYAGADAPPDEQLEQARARTYAVSHTGTHMKYAYTDSGRILSHINRITVDREQDRILRQQEVNPAAWEDWPNRTILRTEDGAWAWSGASPSPSGEVTAGKEVQLYPNPDPHPDIYEQFEDPKVVERTPETVVLRASRSTDGRSQILTVTIDRSAGRFDSIRFERFEDGNRTETITSQYDEYGTASVAAPPRPHPPRLYVYDLLVGPVNGKTPLLDNPGG